MKKLLVLLAFLTFSNTAHAQSKQFITPLICDSSFNVFEILRKADERLMFAGDTLMRAMDGKAYPAGLYIWMNLQTGTSTVTVLFQDLTMCLLAPIKDMAPYEGEQPWDALKDEL